MKETRSERFKRLAEARVNKLIAMIRLLGDLSITTIYSYEPEQMLSVLAKHTLLSALTTRIALKAIA